MRMKMPFSSSRCSQKLSKRNYEIKRTNGLDRKWVEQNTAEKIYGTRAPHETLASDSMQFTYVKNNCLRENFMYIIFFFRISFLCHLAHSKRWPNDRCTAYHLDYPSDCRSLRVAVIRLNDIRIISAVILQYFCFQSTIVIVFRIKIYHFYNVVVFH